MTTFATTTTKTNQPLQLFTMFPSGGASNLKGFTAPAFGTAATGGSAADALRHHFRGSQHGEEEGPGADPGVPPVLMVDGPTPPVRPVRHVQHATQWAESKTTVAPGLIVRSTTASVSTSQWSEYSSTVTEGIFHGQSSSSSTQFQTIHNSTSQSTIAATSNPCMMSSAQYLDDLQLPTQQLDLAAQLGKGSIARKGSLGGRRPPTVRYRRVNSQGSLPYEEQHQLMQQHQQQEKFVPVSSIATSLNPPKGLSVLTMNGTESIRNGRSRTPPPRPPPPNFRQQQKPLEQQTGMLAAPVPSAATLAPPATDWNSSRSGTPPSLPANSPPPLPDREDLDFVMDEVSSSASVSSSSTPNPGMTDVVEINDKESVGENGEVVRRRTIITLGPRAAGGASSAGIGTSGSSSSINVTLLNGGPACAGLITSLSSQSNELLTTKTKQHPVAEQAVPTTSATPDETQRANTRASAFNARRTIEQRRQQQIQQQQQQQEEEEEEMQEPEPSEQPLSPVASNVKTPPPSTYLYGEKGSPASSFGGSSLRTMSISMSFDDLDESNSNASITDQQRRAGGRNRSEAWYERRQSYGFEAADKLQSLLNTSGSSDVPSITGTAVSRSCDSLCSTVRSTSSAIEKMIPPWIKNPSPKQAEEEIGKSPSGSSRLSYFGQSMDDVSADDESEDNRIQVKDPVSKTSSSVTADHKSYAQPRRTPTPTSIQRSESSRSATNVLEEAEPIWLRDLRVRRSLRDGRRKPPVIKSPPPMETPIWLGVKLRPTGLSLVDPDPSAGPTSSSSNLPSPTKPHNYTPIFTFTNTSTTSKIQQHLRNSHENLLVSSSNSNITTEQTPESIRRKSEERQIVAPVTTILKVSASSIASSNESKEDLSTQQTVIESSHSNNTTTFRLVPAKTSPKTASSSIVIVNSSRESLHSTGTVDSSSSYTCETSSSNKLNHHRSIELMRMLDETSLMSSNGIPLRHDRTDSASAVNTETGSVYSMGDWTESSSAVASVKNSNEDLTQINHADGQRKAKKVAFGADVKEESDQKRSRPRRIRSRSPESRLREWQERLEEVKSTVIHHHVAGTVHHQTEFGAGINTTASSTSGLPLRRFGDDIKNLPEMNSSINNSTAMSSNTSDTFRSLLQPRKPYGIVPPVSNPAVATPVKESIVIDSYPPMMKAYSTGPSVEIPVYRPAPVVIRNGIVNFDSSVERKIVILEEKETIPAPKSILKKRSVENLLDIERMIEPVIKPAVIAVTQATVSVIPVLVPGSQSVHSGITVSMTNQKKEPPPEQQEILPWRIHLKHVEQPPTINSIAVQQQQELESIVPPWRMEINRKKTPPFVARAQTPDNFFSRGRSPCSTTSESSTATIPGMSAAELIRNLRPNPVMMVARCEVKESVFRQPISTDLEADMILPLLESDPTSFRADHGYHSLEPEAESIAIKRHQSIRQQTVVDETKTIDETIAQLNETIEEIRSLDVIRTEAEFDRNGMNSTPTQVPIPVTKMDIGNPAASSSPYPIKVGKTNSFYPGLSHSKSSSKVPENRFVVREIRPSGSVQEARTIFQSTASSEITHRSSTVASGRRDSTEAEAPEIKAPSVNYQLQRLRETTKLLADGHPQLRADLVVNPRLSQASETNHNGSSHSNQNGDVPTSIIPATKSSPGQKRRQSFVMASGVEHHDVTAVHPIIPVVHHKPAEPTESRDTSVEELLSKFESTIEEDLSDDDALMDAIVRKSSSVKSMTSTTFSRRSSTAATRLRTTLLPNKTTQLTKEENISSSSLISSLTPKSSGRSKSLPAKRSNSIELTSGMPEEKAALLVRKFFGNSVIESKMSRIAKTETIMEESSEFGCSSSFSEEKTLLEVAVEAFSSPSPQPAEAFECDDFFHRPSSEAEGMSTSSFGSVLDVMDTTTDDERSIRTTSSTTMTNTTRYSSCSERSVKLSDIINRPDRRSLLEPATSSSCATPLMDEFSYATSESTSIAISLCQTTTDSSSVGSDFSRSGSSSICRNKTQRHPTVIRKDKNSIPAVSVKSSTRTPPSRSRGSANSNQSRGGNHRSSASGSPSTSSTPGIRRRSNGSGSTRSAGDPVRTSTCANRSGGSKGTNLLTSSAAPVRPPRVLQQVNQSTEVRKRSVRTSTSGSTLRNATAASSAKIPTSSARKSLGAQADRKTSLSVSSAGVPLANRTNRLVTITSYKSRNSASVKPDDASAVSGIKVTPVAVGSGHYKIRMDQRIAAAVAEKASKTTTKKTSTSQRTNGTKTTTTTSEIRSNTTSSSRNTTVKPDK